MQVHIPSLRECCACGAPVSIRRWLAHPFYCAYCAPAPDDDNAEAPNVIDVLPPRHEERTDLFNMRQKALADRWNAFTQETAWPPALTASEDWAQTQRPEETPNA
jgi:hypothetical protein